VAERIWIDTASQNAWLLGGRLPGVCFRMLQPVEVVAGPNRGASGILISIYALIPEPEYHLETEEGGDLIVLQSQLCAADQ
jgi:hypothetical protein